jgi:hypothetical protein
MANRAEKQKKPDAAAGLGLPTLAAGSAPSSDLCLI